MNQHDCDASSINVERGASGYPRKLESRLGGASPVRLTLLGSTGILRRPLTAIFCSVRPPPDLVLSAVDLARELADSGSSCIGGFQSPVEKLMLEVLLERRVPVVICCAGAGGRGRLRAQWQRGVGDGTLLILSPLERRRRIDAARAAARNRVVAALADEAAVVHAAPGGGVYRLARELLGWGTPLLCPVHPANEELLLLGASGWTAGGRLRDGAPASR